MANIIAIVWDFDKTLVDGYMQDPIFEYYQVDSAAFWKEVNSLPKKYKEEQGEQMRADGRINMYAEADYTEGTTAYMWICNKITEFAERIRKEERDKIAKYAAIEVPKHLTE